MEKVTVSADLLRQVLTAFQGPSHHIMELWAINQPYIDNPVTKLIKEFNAAYEQRNNEPGSAE